MRLPADGKGEKELRREQGALEKQARGRWQIQEGEGAPVLLPIPPYLDSRPQPGTDR